MGLYLPQRYQPNNLFFNLEMGSLSAIYQNPEIPVDFECTLPISGTGQFEMILFDQTGKDVEPYFWQAFDQAAGNWPEAIIQWGYTGKGGNASPPYQVQMCGYELDTRDDGSFNIRFGGSFSMAAISSCNPNGGTLEQIVTKFAKDQDMSFEIIPPFDSNHMMEYGKHEADSTEYREARWHKYSGESDWSFLTRVLESGRDVDGIGNYTASVTTKDGRRHLLITHPTNDAPTWTFEVYSKDSTVVAWRPSVNFMNLPLGGSQLTTNNYQRSTGDMQKFTMQPQLTNKYQTTFGYPLFKQYLPKSVPDSGDSQTLIQAGAQNISPESKGGSLRNRTSGAASPFAGFNPELVKFLRGQLGIHKAQLEVAGDPQFSPGAGVNIEVIYNYNLNYKNRDHIQEHHTSGLYRVESVTHRMKSGRYTCLFNLERSGPSKDPAELPSTGA